MEEIQRKVIEREKWEKVLKAVDITKEDMNKLVMNFLVSKCYVEAVKDFIKESGTEHEDLEKLQARADIRGKILRGDVEDASASIFETYEQLRELGSINFWLRLQTITERIGEGKEEEAVELGHRYFSRCSAFHTLIEEDIEKTYCLLAFEDPFNCPLAEVPDVSKRRLMTANLVNRIILRREGQQGEKLDNMLKELLLVQYHNDEMAAYPQMNISSGILEDPVISNLSFEEQMPLNLILHMEQM